MEITKYPKEPEGLYKIAMTYKTQVIIFDSKKWENDSPVQTISNHH